MRFSIAGGRAAHAPRFDFDPRAEQTSVAEAVVRAAAGLVAMDDEADAVVQQQCAALTALAPRVVLAWTWFGLPDTKVIRPQAVAGAASNYAKSLVIERNWVTEHGPAFQTLRGHRIEPFAISAWSPFGPWRQVSRAHGVKTVLALPLASSFDEQRGLLVLYSDTERYFERVGVGLFEALAHLYSAVLSRAARNAQLKQEAFCDALTGLANRRAMLLMESRVRRLTDLDRQCALILLDIDHFKRINDEHGHARGDETLCAIAALLARHLRQGDAVARWGGEEFLLCLPGADLSVGIRVAEKLRRIVAGARSTDHGAAEGHVRVTASFGVAALRAGEGLEEGVARADRALYRAKAAGRDCVVSD